jgi:hypothetical protein
MSQVTLGFSRVTRARTCQNPYPRPQVQVLVGMGRGFMKTHGYPNLQGVMPPEMTKEPRKSSASVNRHCRAALRGSEGWGNGNRGAEHAPRLGWTFHVVGGSFVGGRSWAVVHVLCDGRSLLVRGYEWVDTHINIVHKRRANSANKLHSTADNSNTATVEIVECNGPRSRTVCSNTSVRGDAPRRSGVLTASSYCRSWVVVPVSCHGGHGYSLWAIGVDVPRR